MGGSVLHIYIYEIVTQYWHNSLPNETKLNLDSHHKLIGSHCVHLAYKLRTQSHTQPQWGRGGERERGQSPYSITWYKHEKSGVKRFTEKSWETKYKMFWGFCRAGRWDKGLCCLTIIMIQSQDKNDMKSAIRCQPMITSIEGHNMEKIYTKDSVNSCYDE